MEVSLPSWLPWMRSSHVNPFHRSIVRGVRWDVLVLNSYSLGIYFLFITSTKWKNPAFHFQILTKDRSLPFFATGKSSKKLWCRGSWVLLTPFSHQCRCHTQSLWSLRSQRCQSRPEKKMAQPTGWRMGCWKGEIQIGRVPQRSQKQELPRIDLAFWCILLAFMMSIGR